LDGLQKLPELCLKLKSAKMLETVDELLKSAFLVDSVDYRAWVADAKKKKSLGLASGD
jgi:hypothetical protein